MQAASWVTHAPRVAWRERIARYVPEIIAIGFVLALSFAAMMIVQLELRTATLGAFATCTCAGLVTAVALRWSPRARTVGTHVARLTPVDPMWRLVDRVSFAKRLRARLAGDDDCSVIVVEPSDPPSDVEAATRTLAWATVGAAGSSAVVTQLAAARFAVLLPGRYGAYVGARIRRACAAVAATRGGELAAVDVVLGVTERAGRATSASAMIESAIRAAHQSRTAGASVTYARARGF